MGNSWFKKNYVYKYTWLRMAVGRVVDKALMDDVLLPRRMLGRLLDVKVWRGEGGNCLKNGSSVEISGWLQECREEEGMRNVLKVSELNNSIKERANQESLHGKYEVITKEDLHRRAGIEIGISSRADQRVLRWFGHVERMDDCRMARRVLMAEVSGGRVRGRPRLGWMDVVKVALGNRGMTVDVA